MSSRRTEPRSIESKLVLLFTAAAGFLLCCGLGMFYWLVVRHAFAEDNEVLADKVAALSAVFNTPNAPQLLDAEVNAPVGRGHTAYWIRILDSQGQVMTETKGMSQLLPPDIFPSPIRSTSSFRVPKNYRTEGKLFSLVARQETAGSNGSIVQVAQDRSADEQFTKEFGALLAAVLAIGILASAFIAITVTRRGLRPLGEMTRSLERINPSHLSERVAPTRWPPELQPLAIAFDEMLDRLEDSFTRLSQFSADLAHELRTPVANILGEAQVALTRERTSNEYREVIESTVGECERLTLIVDNLLFLARAEGSDKQIQPSLFQGRAAIEKIAAYYQTLAEERHITIRCEGEAKIFADPILFERALSNLVDNALRFTPAAGTIRISIASRGKDAEASISDTGAGIAPEHLPRVFDRFYRADPSRSSQGTGLGLALVKSIVDLHRGSASIQSEINRGTTVVLAFPYPNSADATA